MDVQQLQARIEALETNQARIDAQLSGAILATNGLHEPVAAVATVNVPVLSGLLVIDGVITFEGSRVFLANQGVNGGLWVTHAGAWTRPSDWQTGQVIQTGEIITVAQGTTFTRFGGTWMVTQGGIVDTGQILAFPALDKGTDVLDIVLADRWILAGAKAFCIDTTIGAVAAVNVINLTPGVGNFGRATGGFAADGTAPHVADFQITNF